MGNGTKILIGAMIVLLCLLMATSAYVFAGSNPALDLIRTLKKAGVPLVQITARVAKTFNKTKSQMAQLLTQAGFRVSQIALALKNALRATPAQVAKALKHAGNTAATIAKTLKIVYRASPSIIALALKTARYSVREIAKALQQGIRSTPGQIAGALRQARYNIGQIVVALKNGLRLSAPLVATALRVARYVAVDVGRVIKDHFSAAKDQVERALRAAGYPIHQIQAALQILFKVSSLDSRQQLPTIHPNTARSPWIRWCEAAWQASRFAINTMWITQAYFKDIRINSVMATGSPGCLQGPNLKSYIKSQMLASKVPLYIADPYADGIASAWRSWQSGVTVPALPWYPSFASFPGPHAPPTPNLPTPLAVAVSGKINSVANAGKLARTILKKLGRHGKSVAASTAVKNFCARFSARFLTWVAGVKIMNVLGTGPVPTYSPPYVPTGPVVNGWVLKSGPALSPTKF